MEKIGGWTEQPLVAGACSLCGNEGIGNLGLWLCERHISIIAREHGYSLEPTLREQIARGIEAISDYQVLETTNRKGFESQMEVTDAVKKLAIAIARGNKE